MKIHTYTHCFPGGITATVRVSLDPPSYSTEWSRPPTIEVLPEYFRWRETIVADLAERTGRSILVVTA
jgi:hypothetical protein